MPVPHEGHGKQFIYYFIQQVFIESLPYGIGISNMSTKHTDSIFAPTDSTSSGGR